MRIAYYGLSSPIFYDYSLKSKRCKNDVQSSPNPMLDGGFGSILLFDEIWFFCRSLCPHNMRNLPYVKFLDDELPAGKISMLKSDFDLGVTNNKVISEKNNVMLNFPSLYKSVIKNMGISWEAHADNHTHTLQVDKTSFHANSFSYDNILFDLKTVEMIKEHKGIEVEFITNSFTSNWLGADIQTFRGSKITEILLFENIPTYIDKHGPYHPAIEELRNNKYIENYRQWVSNNPYPDKKDLLDIKNEVATAIAKESRKSHLERLNPTGAYLNITKTVLGFVPGYGSGLAIWDLIETAKEDRIVRDFRWQGFVIYGQDIIYEKVRNSASGK